MPTSDHDLDPPPSMTPRAAAAAPNGTEVVVEGFLFVEGAVVTMAELMAESFPPQPGGATIEVEGIDRSELEQRLEFERSGPIRWTNAPVSLTGTVNSGRLTAAAFPSN